LISAKVDLRSAELEFQQAAEKAAKAL